MAFSLDFNLIDSDIKKKVSSTLIVKPKKTQYNPNPQPLYVFNSNRQEKAIYIPIGQYTKYLEEFPHSVDEYSQTNFDFTYQLFTAETDPKKRGRDQETVAREAISKLKHNHTVFISCFTGYGKTVIGTFLLTYLKLKTVILCHNDTIKVQWKDEIIRLTGGKAKVQMIRGNKLFDPEADVYIVGIQKAVSIKREDVLDIGTVLVDEAHICTAAAFTKSLLRFQPMYLIGLSATPDRRDGLHVLLNIYFGSPQDFIVREEVKNFTVTKYQTRFSPEVSYMFVRGKPTLAWTDMMTSLAMIKDRWIEIAELAISHPSQKIIILCDRQQMAENIYNYLLEKNESAELLIGNKKEWNREKRILVTGVKKGGVGLNDENLTMLILAADMKDVRQCEGRIRTTGNLVYDIVDNYQTLENHWRKREMWYLKRGADIKIGGTVSSSPRRTSSQKRYLPRNLN